MLVTGANRGIGAALVQRFARRRARVLAGMRDPTAYTPPDAPAAPGAIRAVRIDLSSASAIDASFEGLGAERDRIEVLVNNAGRLTTGLLEEQAVSDIDAMFQVNLVGLVHLTRLMLPSMIVRGRGMIVNNASISAYAHLPTATTYSASKAGVAAFTESLRRELRGTGVSCMTVITPAVTTDMLAAVEAGSGRFVDMSAWHRISADAWAMRIVRGVELGRPRVEGDGRVRLLRVLSQGPPSLVDRVARRMFSREQRGA